ncbi:hypothetical protein [Polaribacter sp. R77954]|uniref:hypothetical protein n=1 Tax=Polaribacter sp. R77954 TaxID=3093870 RepID=UPI0037CCA36B
MKKSKLKKILIYTVIFISVFTLFDLYILRGLNSSYFIFKKNIDLKKTEFIITKKEDGIFNFSIKNNSIIPDYFMFYREGNIFLNNVEQIVFMGNRSRVLNTKNNIEKINLSFGCSNGLGLCSINPYEKFEKDYSYKEVLNEINYINNISDNKNNDLLFGEKLFLDKENLIFNHESKITKKDSLEIEFYYGLFSEGLKEQYPIKSNVVKIGYLDLIESYIEKELKWRKENN